jgi:hypothetical protein
MMRFQMYPGFVELVHKKIDDGKSLMKNLEGTVRRQNTPSLGSTGRGRQVIEKNSVLLPSTRVEGRRKKQ